MIPRAAYCTGFWCTNLGNGFFSLGAEYALKQLMGEKNVTLVSDVQTYTTGYGKRLYPAKNQLDYLSKLDVDYLVLAGPVLSKYFLQLWKDVLIALEQRGVRYVLLSAGMMKMTDAALKECQAFFRAHPPYVFCSRDRAAYEAFGAYAEHSYDGVCFSFFAPDYYSPAPITEPYIAMNFDKIGEPAFLEGASEDRSDMQVSWNGKPYHLHSSGLLSRLAAKTDRFTDALAYAASILPQKQLPNRVGEYAIYRPDHRFHPHFRSKIYGQSNAFCADLPYGYLELYANSALTLSDRVHACAVTLAFGHEAMLFAKTGRDGLLARVGAEGITEKPVSIDLERLASEKDAMLQWLKPLLTR